MKKDHVLKEFVRKQKEARLKGKKSYLHFDNRINPDIKIAREVSSPSNVEGHSFYPFLHFTDEKRRFKNKDGARMIEVKRRELFYSAHYDSLIYSWYAYKLSSLYEKKLESLKLFDVPIAYRTFATKKDNRDFAKEVFDFIKTKEECIAIALDVDGFFDNLDHKILKQALFFILGRKLSADVYKVFRSLTKYHYVEVEEVYELFDVKKQLKNNQLSRICKPFELRDLLNRKNLFLKKNKNIYGIPQGTPLSAILSNIYMLGFDARVQQQVNSVGGLYRRYSDDIIIVCTVDAAKHIITVVLQQLDMVKLKPQDSKTEVVLFKKQPDGRFWHLNSKSDNKPLQYLGFEFDGNTTLIRSSSFGKYYRKIKTQIKNYARNLNLSHHPVRLKKKQLFKRFTHLGKNNFIAYTASSARKMGSIAIRKQAKSHVKVINREILKREDRYKV